MVNDRKLLIGGVMIIALLAIIAGGCTGSMNNTPVSNTSTPTAEASPGGGAANTSEPSSSSAGQPAQNPSGSQASPGVNSPEASPGINSPTASPQPSASTLPFTVVSGTPMKATTTPGLGHVATVAVKPQLATPKLVSPTNWEDCQDLTTITLKWQAVAGASGYYVEMQYSDDNTTWKPFKTANADVASYTDSSLTTRNIVKWRVTAMDSTQNHRASNPSGWWAYTTYKTVDKIIANP